MGAEAVLGLQRQFGNAAVTRLVGGQNAGTALAPIVMRLGTVATQHPNEDVLGRDCWLQLRADLQAGASFTVVKTLSAQALAYLVPSPPPSPGVRAVADLVIGVLTAAGNLDAHQLGPLLIALQQAGVPPGDAAAAITPDPGFLAANAAHLEDARWALAHAPNHPAVLAYLLRYKGGDEDAIDLAKQELASAQGNVLVATVAADFLLPYLSQGPEVVEFARDEFSADLDAVRAKPVVDFLLPFRAEGSLVVKLARQELDKAGGVASKARDEMAVLARYHYDPELRAWAESTASGISGARLAGANKQAESTRAEAIKALGERPIVTKKMSHNLHLRNQTKIRQSTYDTGKKAAEEAEKLAREASAAQAPLWEAEALSGIEGHLAERTPEIGPGPAAWTIRAAGGDTKIAGQLARLFGVFHEADAKELATWVMAVKQDWRGRAVEHLCKAGKCSIPASTAQSVTEAVLGNDELDGRLVDVVASDPKAWEVIREFLGLHAGQAGEVLAVLERGCQAGIHIAKLVEFAGRTALDEFGWALRYGSDLVEASKARVLLSLHSARRVALEMMLRRGDLADVVALVEHDSEITELWAALPGLVPSEVLDLMNEGFLTAELKLYLVGHRRKLADLAAASAAAGGAPALRSFIGSYKALLPDVVEAFLVKGSWDCGTFPNSVKSILYHYCKHVLKEKRREDKSITSYTADALATLNGRTSGHVRVDGVPGGYFQDGKVLTYWYTGASALVLRRRAEPRQAAE